MMTSEYLSYGAKLREEGDKALHRALIIAVVIVMAHLLDIRPSELDAGGIKIAFKDISVVYGALSLAFWYSFFRYLSRNSAGDFLFPTENTNVKLRRSIKYATSEIYKDKSTRRKPGGRSPISIKKRARSLLILVDVILFPYRAASAILGLAGAGFATVDLYRFVAFVLSHSAVVAEGWNVIAT